MKIRKQSAVVALKRRFAPGDFVKLRVPACCSYGTSEMASGNISDVAAPD
jgi:hypothetical protein